MLFQAVANMLPLFHHFTCLSVRFLFADYSLLGRHACYAAFLLIVFLVRLLDQQPYLRAKSAHSQHDDTWIQIIKEQCFLLKASSYEQRRRAGKKCEKGGREGWRERCCLWATGINWCQRVTFTVEELLLPQKWKLYTVSMQKSSTHASNGPVADAFCKRYWNIFF